MKAIFKYVISFFVVLTSQLFFAQQQIKPDNKKLSYIGRVTVSKDSAIFYWPGSAAKINFVGSALKVTMKSFRERGFFYAIIDNDMSKVFKIESDTIKQNITLAEGLSKTQHSLQLYKLSNNTSANVLYGFEIGETDKLLKPSKLFFYKYSFAGF